MAITIDGTAVTIAGLVAGGLPDGSIINADIATVAASKLTGGLPAISGASLTGITGGLVLVASSVDHGDGGTTYSDIIIDQCFSSTYQNYLVIGSLAVETSSVNLAMQWRVGGSGSESTHTTANYKWVGMDYENVNGSLTKNSMAHDSDDLLPLSTQSTPHISDGNYFNMWVYSPQISGADTTARYTGTTYDAQNDIHDRVLSLNSPSVSATGFRLYCSSGNLDEHGIRVYGLVDS